MPNYLGAPGMIEESGGMGGMPNLFGGPDLSMYGGLFDPAVLEALKAQASQRQRKAFGASLLQAAAPRPGGANFAAGLGNAFAASQQAGDQFLQQQIPLSMGLTQMRQKQSKEQEAAAQDAKWREAAAKGDWAAAAAIDPAKTQQFRGATAPVEGPQPQMVKRDDGSVAWVMPGQNLGPLAPKPQAGESKPIYGLDGKPLGNALIVNGVADIGGQKLGPGQYTTEKPDNARASPAAMTLQNDIKDRLAKINAAKTALANAKESLKGTQGLVFDTGPVDALLDFTPSNNKFNNSIASLAAAIRPLTRTPGEGSMSDFETKLQQAALPSQSNYYTTNEQALRNIEQMVTDLEADYQRRLQGGAPAAASGWSAVEVK